MKTRYSAVVFDYSRHGHIWLARTRSGHSCIGEIKMAGDTPYCCDKTFYLDGSWTSAQQRDIAAFLKQLNEAGK
jgi:hypothetical protein